MNVQWVRIGRFRHVGDTYFVALNERPPEEVEDTLFRLPDVTMEGERWHAYIAPDLKRTSAFPMWVQGRNGMYMEMVGVKAAVSDWMELSGRDLVKRVVEEGLR